MDVAIFSEQKYFHHLFCKNFYKDRGNL